MLIEIYCVYYKRKEFMTFILNLAVVCDSSVDIATRYGMDGPGIECR